jgi:hypothetical protein
VRKLVIGAAAVMLLAVMSAVAYGATVQKFKQTLTTASPGKGAGTKFSLEGSDPNAPENNFRGKPTRVVDLAFPLGTLIDPKGAPQCKATDGDFASKGEAACPASTRVDNGKAADNAAEAKLRQGGPITVKVTAFNAAKGLLLYLRPTIGSPFVLRPVWKGTATKRHLVTTVKAITVPGDEIVLTKFKLSTKVKTVGKRTLIRTPAKKYCPKSKLWTFKGTLTYSDGTKQKVVSQQKCKR